MKPGRDTAPGFFMPACGAKGIEDGVRAALRICMDRLLPPRRHEPVTLDLPPLDKVADTVAATSAIVAAVAAGDLTAAEAADLAKVVDVHVQALATAAFEARLARLEQSRAH